MRIAIVGGTGFVGTALARAALAAGHTPLVIARGHHPIALPEGAIFAEADRMDGARLAALFREHGIESVVDIFCLGLRNTAPVLEAMGAVGGRYLLLSSVDVYSNYGGLLRRESPPVQAAPAKEYDPLRAFRFPYRQNSRRPQGVDDDLFDDYDKIILEEAALGDGRFATTVIRAPMIFGPGDKQHRFRWAIDAVRRGGRVAVDERAANWPNSYGYIDDIAAAMLLGATDPRAEGRTYNVGQSFVRTPVEWLRRFADLLGQPIEIDIVPPEAKGLLHERADASDLRYPLTLDATRIRTELGFTETLSEDEALRRTVAAERV